MTIRATHVIYAALAVGAVAWWLTRGAGPEAEIRERFDRLVELVEKEPGESALDGAERAREVGRLFMPDFVLDVPAAGSLTNREALVRPFVGLRMQVDRLEIVVPSVDVELGPTGDTARLGATAAVVGTGGPSGGFRRGNYALEVEWRRDGSDWRIAALQARETEGLLP